MDRVEAPLIATNSSRSRPFEARSIPNLAVVYVRRTGQLIASGRLSFSERLLGFGQRYEVDLGDRFHELTARLPARGDAHQFDAAISLTYRVTDPTEVVRRHIVDGVPPVVNRVIAAIRPVARKFPIEEVGAAEETINDRFRAPVVLPEGITIVRCDVRLTLEESVRHVLHYEWERERSAFAHRLEAHERRDGDTSLLATLLASDPQDTAKAFELLLTAAAIETDRQAERGRASLELLRLMIDKGLLQASDVETIRSQVIEGLQVATTGTPVRRVEVLAHEPRLLPIERAVTPEIDGGASADIVVRSGEHLWRGTAFQVGPRLLVAAAESIRRDLPVDSVTAQPAGASDPIPARILFVDHTIGIAIIEMGEAEDGDRDDHVLDVLLGLALAYGGRYATAGADGDLATTIALYQQAIAKMPTADVRRPSTVSNFAAALRSRYERYADAQDLDAAIGLLREALAVTSADQPERSVMLSNLAAALRARAKRTGSSPDLDESVVLLREALAASAPDQPERPVMLSNLAAALQAQYERTGSSPDLDESVVLLREALTASAPDQPERPVMLSNLAAALQAQYEYGADSAYLDESVTLLREALGHTPEPHTRRKRIEALLRQAVDLQSSREAS